MKILVLILIFCLNWRAFGSTDCSSLENRKMITDFELQNISAANLKNSFFAAKCLAIFNPQDILRILTPPSTAKNEIWMTFDSQDLKRGKPILVQDVLGLRSHNEMLAFTGAEAFGRLIRYVSEVKDLMDQSYAGEWVRLEVTVRIDTEKNLTRSNFRSHRGYRKHPIHPSQTIEVSVLKSELGPPTLIKGFNGKFQRFDTESAVFITDAIYAEPFTSKPRLLVTIDAEFKDDIYSTYYSPDEYPEWGRQSSFLRWIGR